MWMKPAEAMILPLEVHPWTLQWAATAFWQAEVQALQSGYHRRMLMLRPAVRWLPGSQQHRDKKAGRETGLPSHGRASSYPANCLLRLLDHSPRPAPRPRLQGAPAAAVGTGPTSALPPLVAPNVAVKNDKTKTTFKTDKINVPIYWSNEGKQFCIILVSFTWFLWYLLENTIIYILPIFKRLYKHIFKNTF